MREGIFWGWWGGGGGHACGFLENAIMTIKLLIFSPSSVMLLSGLKIHHH